MPSTDVGSSRPDCYRLTLYNHKGGVGKTTLTVNIAAALAELGKRVLLVDSDPQCNLTSYLVEDRVVDDLLDSSDTPSGQTLWSALRPIAEATGDVNHRLKPLERRENLFLIPGDLRLAEFENDLDQMWGECLQRKLRGFRGTTALSRLVNHIASRHDIDFVFYDSGPNIGPLNRTILLDCDAFVIPAACDLFSLRALKTLGKTLAHWVTDWKIITDLAPSDVYLFPGTPHLLGYIPQRFRVYGQRPTTQYARFLPRLERHLHSDVVTVLRRADASLVTTSVSHLKLGEVKDFGSLASESQNQGLPLADVGTRTQRSEAAGVFGKIASQLIRRLEKR